MNIHLRIEEIDDKVRHASSLYYRLVLVVGSGMRGKSAVLRGFQERSGAPLVNVNLHLSRTLHCLDLRSRAQNLPKLLNQLVEKESQGTDTILLDNIEVLFDAALKQNPLRILETLARHRTVVATWNGNVGTDALTYAKPGHPEYRCYSLGGPAAPLIVHLEGAT